MHKENEDILRKRILDGEINLFSYFVERYSAPLHSLIVRVVLSREDAEELTQDVLIKAFNKLRSFKGESSFSTWLFRIAYNTAISATRKNKIVYLYEEESQITNVADSAVDELLNKEDDERVLQELEKAIDKLRAEDSLLLNLFYYQEKSVTEIAYILGLSVENVKVKLYRVRKKLYSLIKSNE